MLANNSKLFLKKTLRRKAKKTKTIAKDFHLGKYADACHPSTARQSNMAERWSAEAEDDRSAWEKSFVKDAMGMIVIW